MPIDWRKILLFTALYLLIFVPLELLMPVRRKGVMRPGIASDVAHFYVTGFLTKAVQAAFVLGLAYVANAGLRGLEALNPDFHYKAMQAAVRAQPIWLQIPELLLFSDFLAYWTHRAQHEVKFLWRFHAVHHSPTQMDWLTTTRLHPLDQALKTSIKLIPGLLLGFSIPALGAAYAIMGVVLSFWVFAIHANVKLNLGPLEYLHITPHFHHWHHALNPVNKNYSDQFPVWDLLFGSFHMPRGEWPAEYGTHAPVPLNWALQMLHPFNPQARFSYQGAQAAEVPAAALPQEG